MLQCGFFVQKDILDISISATFKEIATLVTPLKKFWNIEPVKSFKEKNTQILYL